MFTINSFLQHLILNALISFDLPSCFMTQHFYNMLVSLESATKNQDLICSFLSFILLLDQSYKVNYEKNQEVDRKTSEGLGQSCTDGTNGC
jgi:hypothetical protein